MLLVSLVACAHGVEAVRVQPRQPVYHPNSGLWVLTVSREMVEDIVGPAALAQCEELLRTGDASCSIAMSSCATLAVFAREEPRLMINGHQCYETDLADHWLVLGPEGELRELTLPGR